MLFNRKNKKPAKGGASIFTPTPLGHVKATVMPDLEYPGIAVQHVAPDGTELASCLFEYDPVRKRLQLQVWDPANPEGDPVQVIPMSIEK